MNISLAELTESKCKKFLRLAGEVNDRDLSSKEEKFMEAHRCECEACRHAESTLATSINLLRTNIFECEPSPAFDDRLIRRIQLVRVRTAPPYWLPALAGAAIGAVCLFGLVQVIAGGPAAQPFVKPVGEARHIPNPEFSEPQLILPTHP